MHSNTKTYHLLQSWAQHQIQQSKLLQTWGSFWTLCSLSDSNCANPASPWQNQNPASHSLSQSWQNNVCMPPVFALRFFVYLSPSNCEKTALLVSLTLFAFYIFCLCNLNERKPAKTLRKNWHSWSFVSFDGFCFLLLWKLTPTMKLVERLGHLAQCSEWNTFFGDWKAVNTSKNSWHVILWQKLQRYEMHVSWPSCNYSVINR